MKPTITALAESPLAWEHLPRPRPTAGLAYEKHSWADHVFEGEIGGRAGERAPEEHDARVIGRPVVVVERWVRDAVDRSMSVWATEPLPFTAVVEDDCKPTSVRCR